jgi:hypothetical protein
MPNWTIIRLREKAKGNISEGLFRRLENKSFADTRKAETVDEFLKRGGKIRQVNEPERSRENEMP